MRLNSLKLIVIALFLSCLAHSQTHPHDPNGTIRAALGPLISSQFGSNYVFDYAVLDSLLGRGPTLRYYYDMTDPYGTLRGCIIFWARPRLSEISSTDNDPDDSTIVGIFRNGSIVWNTPPICRGGFSEFTGSLFCSQDLNGDGQVEFAMLSEERDTGPVQFMWIFSWNGSTGTIINQIDDGTHQSNLMSEANTFELIDPEGDGIFEIRGYWSPDDETRGYFPEDTTVTFPWVTYGWNRSQYGLWPETQQVPGNASLPANLLQVEVHCAVAVQNGLRIFSYEWFNSLESEQKISSINLMDIGYNGVAIGPPGWDTISSSLINGKEWYVLDWKKNLMIRPGQSRSGFELRGDRLPSIVHFYVQGFRPPPLSENMEEITLAILRDDVLSNSVHGFTIGPVLPPPLVPFVSVALTDTLLSFTGRSRSLNWILDQQTTDKYTGLFTRVRSDLDLQDKTMAQLRLDTVLAQIGPDSVTHLTTEACALLRFNTEYLKTVIPEDPLPIQLWYFTAEVVAGRHVELDWGTLSELNNYGFFVQKSQSETSGFSDIPGSYVAGHGTTNQPHEYSWIDTSTSPGQWHYRLKQVDLDGTLHYTEAERVYIPEESQRTEIVNFKAGILSDNSVFLEWITLSEYLCEGFYVQRKADGEEEFQDVNEGFVSGHGTTNEEHLYSFTDSEVKEGKWSYRLKHQGDGTDWYSDTIHVTFTGDDTEVGPLSAESLAQRQVSIDWSTRREVGNGYFEVQVSRGDSLHYRPVPYSRVSGHGTSTQRWKYTYRDTRPTIGIWYYRLKQVNVSRQARYTRGIRVSVR